MGLWNWLRTGEWEPADGEERELARVDIGAAFDEHIVATTRGEAVLPAVFRARQFLADTVASLSLDEIDERTGLVTGTTPNLLRSPSPFETYHEFMHKTVNSLTGRGNAYWRIFSRDAQDRPSALDVLHPDEVTVSWDRNRIFPVYRWRGRPMRRDRDIIHIPLFLVPGDPTGKSPVEIARIALEAAEAEQDFHRSLFRDNATPTGIIQVEGKTQAEVDEIQKRIDEKAKEGKRLPRVMSNATFQQITINPADAQFLEARHFSVQEVARLFGIPGLFLGVTTGDSLTYSTTESLFRLFVTGTLRPTYLERIEQAFTRLLVRGKAARFNISELLRADIKARYEAYQIGLASGFLTKNEVRRDEGLPPIAGGDEIPDTQPAPPEVANA
mgnify:CR=1 FL=1